jgi:hypothetical protein
VKRISATIVMVVALILAATTYAAVLRKGSTKPRSIETWPGIVVSGHVSGLYPGMVSGCSCDSTTSSTTV